MKTSWQLNRSPMRKRSWALEVGLGALATALGAFFLWTTISEGDGAPLPVELLAGALSAAGLIAFRRSRPVALTLVLIPAGIFFGLPMGATPVALFAVGLHRRVPVAAALTVLYSVTVTGVYYLVLGPTRIFVEATVFFVLLHVSTVAVAMVIRSHRLLVRSWADRARQAEEGEKLRVEQARLGERELIAREMHDVLAHRISLLAVHAGALEVRRDAPESERQAAGVIRNAAYEALEDLRGVIRMLRTPAEDHPQPSLSDVPALVEESRVSGAEVDLVFVMDVAYPVPSMIGLHAYRIVQEALTNARKHAPGAPVRVDVVTMNGSGLMVEVGNPVHGVPDPEAEDAAIRRTEPSSVVPGAGVGLVGLGERVHLAGGRLEHGPTETGEFQLKAWLPWSP
ncbi:sensor histidine kinase [Actinoplanes sp. NPDC051494]|uniref:sensor histidine kinase n=1 Tax=Actinoplanes sp. NPDC051494 TaxID=3363907 RepID=UPI0037ACB315